MMSKKNVIFRIDDFQCRFCNVLKSSKRMFVKFKLTMNYVLVQSRTNEITFMRLKCDATLLSIKRYFLNS